ncbi:aminopeptidase [Aneurinibacillus sp. Ricciae_BoGa-3]|uniref:aminopeptidase n=1 Tax=Aneurinibacillus sp. Ricciae_BoGa-3 TaxID=3022697 RepID=UPI00233FFD39|nr:aminopeptidase [Aneurinibacillus sp. Ricciae_BoGa-3]WCK52707.1 aminopeptidase [Aneurinibacillus sp. Ricciae_BoGa-3]
MSQSNAERLAEVLVRYSTRIKPGEKVLIEAIESDNSLVKALIKEIHNAGGHPFVNLRNNQILRQLLLGASEEQIRTWAAYDAHQMEMMDAYIAFRGTGNLYELSDVPADKLKLYNQIYNKQVHTNIRVKKTKWVVLRYPNGSMAQLANMSTEAFEEFYYEVCTMNYEKMDKALDSLAELMNSTDRVRLVAPGTDLSFSIKDIPAVKCAGHLNVPDGEAYTAPVRDSVNGVISFNTPSPYNGFVFENVKLTFKDGKIIEATANDTERINKILDTDEGAHYIGEFAIGVNPLIREPMKDILFDEKIDGSLHFTPGQCYDDAYNGNQSAIHWDMVLIQRPEYGGGEIWFDDTLIRKDGKFVLKELEILNPENLK